MRVDAPFQVMRSLIVVLALSACNKTSEPERRPAPPRLDIAAYDRSCKVAAITPCDACGCALNPIAAKDVDRYQAAASAIKCPSAPDVQCKCERVTVDCVNGQCTKN
jgi:hypothetical protein